MPLILATVLSHLLQWAVAYAKFGRLAAYHSITGKIWGCSLFFACLMLFASDGRKAPGCAWLACAPGLLNNAHEIAMSCVLDRWTPVPPRRPCVPATAPPATVRIRSAAADRLRVGADGAGALGTVCFPSDERRVFCGRVVAAGLAASGRRGAGCRLDNFPLASRRVAAAASADRSGRTASGSVRHRPRERRRRRRGYNQLNRRPLEVQASTAPLGPAAASSSPWRSRAGNAAATIPTSSRTASGIFGARVLSEAL